MGIFADLTSKHLHFDGSFRSKVSFEHFLETFSGVDIDAKGSSFSDDVSLSIDELKRGHLFSLGSRI